MFKIITQLAIQNWSSYYVLNLMCSLSIDSFVVYEEEQGEVPERGSRRRAWAAIQWSTEQSSDWSVSSHGTGLMRYDFL